MFIGVKNGRAVSVRGNPDHPVNAGVLCPKGFRSTRRFMSRDARTPAAVSQRRGNRSSIASAGTTRSRRWRRDFVMCSARHGNDAVGIISTGQLVTEEFYALGKLAQLGLGTRNYDGNTTLCMATAVSGYKRSFGSDGPPGAYEDLEHADVILLIGANIADNHPDSVAAPRGESREDADRRRSARDEDGDAGGRSSAGQATLGSRAHQRDHPHPDRERSRSITNTSTGTPSGFDALYESVREYTPDSVSEITGLSGRADLSGRRSLYGNARAAFIGWTMGVNHSSKGTETVNAINNLALITGNIGRVGAAPFSITGQCNAMGTREAGFASSMPGYRKFEDARTTGKRSRISGRSRSIGYRPRAASPIRTSSRRLSKRKIRALWIIATNPIVSFPNLGVLTQALETLEFLVVQDGFHPTPTSEFADLVLPAAIWGEKEGTYTNSERRVSKVNRAVDPPGEARADFSIFLDVASALGCRDELFPGWTAPRDAFEEWKRVSEGRLCDYSAMTYEAIEASGGIQWPYRGGRRRARRDAPPLRGRPLRNRGRDGATDSRRSGRCFPSRRTRVSVRPEYGAHRRALAHADEDRACRHSGAPVASGVARDEPSRRARAPA